MGRTAVDRSDGLMVVGTADRTAEVASRRWLPARTPDVAVPVGYLALAVWLTHRQWGRPDRLFHQAGDQILFEWMLARAARAVAGLENPLWSDALNAPGGVNLMANTSVLGLGVPLAPVTLLLGSQAAFVVAVVLCLAGTATAWYVLLRRRMVDAWPAAAVGGLVCGFAPGMIAQAGTHLHMAAQFLVPLILALVFRPEPGGRVWRHGVLLGLVVTYQVFLGEEVLLFVALAAGVLVGAYAIADPSAARRLAPSTAGRIGVGALVAGVLLAYPLWFQFFGPGHYRGMPFHAYSYQLDAASFTRFARQTLFGVDRPPGLLAPNPTEENSFFGVGLLLLAVVVAVWLRRRPLVRALAACGLVFALLSLGPRVRLDGRATDLPGPYRLIAELPLLDHVVPARFALVCIPVLGVLVALGVDRWVRRTAVDTAPARPRRRATVRLVGAAALAVALLPLVPTPIRTVSSRPVPAFVADGTWRTYLPAGRTLVPVPPVTNAGRSPGMLWSARTGLAFTAPGGFFIGPHAPGDPTARWGAPDRPTSLLLRRVAETGVVPPITETDRRQAVADLRHWRAAVVVQGGLHHGDPVRHTVEALLGPPREIDGALVWDVRPFVG
ncbi:hypothetical protein [Verrucosispora sp. NA02020]|uniref:hypothetical protein n=1 Tax=Verrucosispora sp. NA02020 TaxID=2742132 RepID=UPI0015908805|nr:hypothetical protein [Verrucosispora sp. NA02020]QKW12903.1 hypothetical protein HUT12_08895 [Verrucosispora sp. NA02020]